MILTDPKQIERLLVEGLVPLADLAAELPGRAGSIGRTYQAALRLVQHGSRGVTLEAVQMPEGLCSSRAAVARFLASLGGLRDGATPEAAQENEQQRTQSAAAGRRRWEKAKQSDGRPVAAE